jgi:hypothetical protein
MRAPSLSVGLAVAFLCSLSGAAQAEPVVSIEPRLDFAISDDPRPGPGLAVGAGYSAELYPVLLMPELVLSGSVHPGDATFGQLRATAGLRAGVTAALEPSIYVHGGYGLVVGPGPASHGFAFDAGLALDKRLDRGLTLGGALGYQGHYGDATLHGMVAAMRIAFWL